MTDDSNPHIVEGQSNPKDTLTAPPSTPFCSAKRESCFVVGIGASAGGLEPLEHIFTILPPDCELSLVVVMHLAAEGHSFLVDFLKRYTPMEVLTAEQGALLLANKVYVIPPGADLSVKEGRLHLHSPVKGGMSHHPIDRFLTSLAEDIGDRAVAVILSGAGLDGASGVRRIKECGGLVFVQEPESAINPSMPRVAIATGVVDMILSTDEIVDKLSEIARRHCNLQSESCRTATIDEELQAIFEAVREKTGHDFSSYKRNTVLRRIERRMTVNETGGIRKYVAFLQEDPHEAQALCQEILIGVTGFFRDPEAFDALRREVIPNLFTDRDPGDPVRIWHPCCSTGEEAYSVAMLIREHLEREGIRAKVQIFATDIDEASVSLGRSGIYSDDAAAEVGEERLARFFTWNNGRRQVMKQLREMILFAHHSIIKDPPFSRLDLLVCRNFLIYLDVDMQKRLLSLFHMVLKPGGYLFLGASETVGRDSELFTSIDKKWKIFRRIDSGRSSEILFPFTTTIRKIPRPVVTKKAAEASQPALGTLAEKLLSERYAPPCLVVNERHEVLHITSSTKRYLEVPVGEPTTDLLKMAREELRPTLRSAIYKSFAERKRVEFRGVKVAGETGESAVNVVVEPLSPDTPFANLAMVVLEPAPPPAQFPVAGSIPGDESSKDMLIRQLEEQFRITNDQLQATMEQLETSNEGFMSTNEELMSINEEFQSANEELQSTNEELETSKEELQALNEELVTVNAELQGKVEELNQLNSDMENLFASSDIAAIFLDRNLAIKRFSPAMASILNLIAADIGRPFRHLAGTIDLSGLHEDAGAVLEKGSTVEREVSTIDGSRNFLLRVLPYRTHDGELNGIVFTLVDISQLRQTEEEMRNIALFPLENPTPVLRVKRGGSLLFANRAAERMLEDWRAEYGKETPYPLFNCIENSFISGKLGECEVQLSGRTISFFVVPLPERGYANLYGRDITAKKEAEEKLIRAKEEWERTFDSVPDLIAIMDENHRITRINRAMAMRLGASAEECIGQRCFMKVHGSNCPPEGCPHLLTLEDGKEHASELHAERLGGDFLVTTTPLLDGRGVRIGSVHVARDITERKKAEQRLLQAQKDLDQAQEVGQIGSWRMDIQRNVLTWSRQNYRIFGQPMMTPLRYESFLEKVLPEDREYVDAMWKAALEGKPYDLEHRIIVNGQIKWVREKAFLEYDDEGNLLGGFGITQDISERKRYEQEIVVARESAEDANRAKSLFLANMSHELRTPLTGVLGMLEIARSGSLDENQLEALDTAQSCGRTLLMIINDILDLARIESGKMVLEESPFQLRKSVSTSVDLFRPEARRKGLSLSLEVTDSVPEELIGDRVRLQQVVSNLVGNAVKFTEKGAVNINVTVAGETARGEKMLSITVADTGIGIPEDRQGGIFAPFVQADPSHTRRYGGTGLGLTISRQIVELMGGKLHFTSTEGAGTVFTFRVPFKVAEQSAHSPADSATASPPIASKPHVSARRRLLVAEDDEVTRKVLGYMLQKYGFDTDFAVDGSAAVELWEKGGFDLIIMDGQMPAMDGFTATKAIRQRELERGGHIPIVAMTAHAMKSDEERCIEAGMDAYLSKPIDFKKCIEVIQKLIPETKDETDSAVDHPQMTE